MPNEPNPPNLSVVILSKNVANLRPCIEAVRKHEPDVQVIVVDNGVEWGKWWDLGPSGSLCDLFSPYWNIVNGREQPFVFSRNANIGISAAGPNDVILLNDDALLTTPGGFSTMQRITNEWWPQTGLLAATCNNVGNIAQHRRNWPPDYPGFRHDDRMVCFVCVLIPRATIEVVGPLDETFVDYGMEDDDYCLRTRQAGLGIGITDLVYVDHGSLTSSFRGQAQVGGDFKPNLRRFIAKWGVDNRGLTREQSPWKDLFPQETTTK